jgi:hypothetical protein
MLVKAFELKHEFPFDMSEGVVVLDRDQLIPTTQHRASAMASGRVHVVKPNLGSNITLFGVTHAQHTKMVVFSSGSATKYYWFTRSRRYSYTVAAGSHDLDEAWMNLFKAFMLDGRPSTMQMYDILKHFVLEFLKTLGDREFEYDLSGKWKDTLAHIRVAKLPFMNKQVTVTVGECTRTCDFGKHPLEEMLCA